MTIEMIILVCSIVGTIAFSISGALIGIENELDIFGVIILAITTACCGGLIRDVMLERAIAMFSEWWYPLISAFVAIMVFLFVKFMVKTTHWENSHAYQLTFNLVDSLGLGIFVFVGAQAAFSKNQFDILPVTFYAVLTAVGGGLIRDIMVRKIPVIFRKHIYAVAAIIGSLVYYALYMLNAPYWFTIFFTVALVMIIRYLAYHFKINLPKIHLKENN